MLPVKKQIRAFHREGIQKLIETMFFSKNFKQIILQIKKKRKNLKSVKKTNYSLQILSFFQENKNKTMFVRIISMRLYFKC